ncbi:MAG: asparaginase [Euryarchaeota archaeon]|nr:asparaginase [Euryarchaeota archaeon]
MSEILVRVYRGDLVESVHRGSAAVVSKKGELLYSVGDPYHITYMRSSAKPLQALPVVESGALEEYGINKRELATIVASHSGEDTHIKAVRSILDKIGLDESYLRCGTHMPYATEAKKKLFREGKDPTPIYNNCSGKHAGMLLLSKMKEYPLDSYYKPDHPLQREVLRTIKHITRHEDIQIGIDGCGVPVFGMPLYNMALGFARFGNPVDLKETAASRIKNAMQRYPEQVAGTDRFDTDLMKATKKLISKAGAEGVHCIALLNDGIGIAMKIDDGGSRARAPAMMQILKKMDVLDKEELKKLEKYRNPKNKNHHGDIVGRIVSAFDLHSSLEREKI